MIKRYLCLFLLLAAANHAFASLPEQYGSAPSTMSVGAQSNGDIDDPANNFYAPSLNGFSENTNYSFSQSTLLFNLNKINNVVVLNKSNSELNTEVYGDSDTDYPSSHLFSAHLSTYLIKKLKIRIGLSFYAPLNKFISTDSGDSFEPNYVFYNKRHERTQFEFSLARKFNKFSYSLGAFLGQQAAGESKIIAKDSDPDYNYSSGQIAFSVKPSLALTASFSGKNNLGIMYFTFRDEMKSNMQLDTFVQDPVGTGTFFFDFDIKSLMYFDPQTFTLGQSFNFDKFNILTSISYEKWSHFKSPKLELNKKAGAGIQGSNDYEGLKPNDIIIPKIAFIFKMDKTEYQIGYTYRPTPLANNLNESGNTIDLDKHILSTGLARPFTLIDQNFIFNLALQGHFLESKDVNKTPNNEGGTAGLKIGAPGYSAGGQIYALSVGLSWMDI